MARNQVFIDGEPGRQLIGSHQKCTGPGLTINAIGSKAQGEKIVHWTSALWKGTRKAVNWNAGP